MAVAWRWAAASLLVVALSGCGAAMDPDGFWRDNALWQQGQPNDAALAALGRGDLVRAEALGNDAMRRNPKDPYAMLALAQVYQNTGRPELAKSYYQALLALHPQGTAMVGMGANAVPRSIEDIAADNLAVLSAPPASTGAVAPDPGAPEDQALITRFQTLRRLLDEGLITRIEYDERRGANLGALLRYTAPQPPAVGLTRSAPPTDQVVARLKTLAAHYEEKSISATEQTVERTIILDNLLPAKPERRADRAVPPTNGMDYAALAGRLQHLREANVISDAEQAREKDSMQRAVAAYASREDAAAKLAAGFGPVTVEAIGPGVQLAAYHSEAQARRAWAALQKQFPDELGALQPKITKTAIRRRGVVWRLSAGPLADRKASLALCRSLRRHDQACEPAVLK
jgi:hypothetical protein